MRSRQNLTETVRKWKQMNEYILNDYYNHNERAENKKNLCK